MAFKYRSLKSWKYQITEEYNYQTNISVTNDIVTEFVHLASDGKLLLKQYYAWDGASGGIDTNNILRASLVHDGLCQLIELGKLSLDHRKASDKIFKEICLEDGMSKFRANYIYLAIRAYVKVRYGAKY
ncbi:DUF1353 domain-containing protein [Rickettsiales bacterium]|nr:DUF1353 domain-containing protein [Rickettsiales bacterium]